MSTPTRSRWAGRSRDVGPSGAEAGGRLTALLRHWRLALLLLGLALLVRLPSFVHQLYDPDEATLADQAITLRDGGTIYVDAIDRKPPIPALLYEGTFRLTHSVDLRPVHLLAALALAVAAWAVASDVRLRSTRERWWAGVLLITSAVAFLPDTGQSANYAHFAMPAGAIAMVASRRDSRWSAAVAGVALALAVLCRQTWVIGLVPAAFAIGRRGRLDQLVVFAAGLLAGFAVSDLALARQAPGRLWHWVFASNGGFLLDAPDWSMVSVSFFGGLALLIGLHLGQLWLIGRRLQAARTPDWTWRRLLGDDADLWLWWATATVAWASGFRFFPHYWMQSLPPLALLAAPVAARLTGRALRWVAALLVVTTAAAMVGGFVPGVFRTLPDPEPLAAYVRSHTSPRDRVLVWGNFPEVNWRADRPLGGALVHSDFVTGVSGNRTLGPLTLPQSTPGAREAMMSSLRAHRPAMIVDTSTADIRFYGRYPMTVFPEFARFVREFYRPTDVVDGARIYRLIQR